MSYYGNFASIAMAMAPGIALWLIALPGLPVRGFTLLCLACGAVALLELLFALRIRETRRPPAESSIQSGPVRSGRVSRDAFPIALAMFFGAYTLGAISSFVPIYLSTQNAQNVPIFFLVNAVTMVVSRPLFGLLADRVDRRLLALPLIVCCERDPAGANGGCGETAGARGGVEHLHGIG
jgi:MFS family permease